MNWSTTGTVIFFVALVIVIVAMTIEAIAVARPPRAAAAPVTMERVEYADAAAAALRDEEQRRRELADLYQERVRELIRTPPYVRVADPERTEVIQPALEETGPMMMPTTYISSNGGRGVDPTRRET